MWKMYGLSCSWKLLLPFLISIILSVPVESYMPSFRSSFVPAVSVRSDWRPSRLSVWQNLAGEIPVTSRFGGFLFWKKTEGKWLLTYDGIKFLSVFLGGLFLAASS